MITHSQVYVLAKDLQVGRHNLIVRKLTEADFGLVSFLGFLADGQVIFNPPGRVWSTTQFGYDGFRSSLAHHRLWVRDGGSKLWARASRVAME